MADCAVVFLCLLRGSKRGPYCEVSRIKWVIKNDVNRFQPILSHLIPPPHSTLVSFNKPRKNLVFSSNTSCIGRMVIRKWIILRANQRSWPILSEQPTRRTTWNYVPTIQTNDISLSLPSFLFFFFFFFSEIHFFCKKKKRNKCNNFLTKF